MDYSGVIDNRSLVQRAFKKYNGCFERYFLQAACCLQVVIEAENIHGFSLGTISPEEYGYVNRTPSTEPKLIPASVLLASGQNRNRDLVPNWYLIQTPHADLLGRPPRIYGAAERKGVYLFFIVRRY